MTEIPLRYHFVFGLKPQTEPFHMAFYLCLESCRQVNRPESIHFHYHYEPYGPWWDRIRPHLQLHRVVPVKFVERNPAYWRHAEGKFIKQANLDYAHQSDFLRLQILVDHGGVYADIDTLFVNPLPSSLFGHSFVLGSEGTYHDQKRGENYESLCNAVILSRPWARFGREWLAEMYNLFDGTWNRHSCYGAAMLARKLPEEIHIVPQNYFFRYRATPEDLQLLLEGVDDVNKEMYSIHLWSHLWWEPSRTDFSNFHKGIMTEDHVRTVDTTFNIIARRFID